MTADPLGHLEAIGVDAGASLVKLAARDAEGRGVYRFFPREAIERVAAEVESAGPDRVGLTGGGAGELAGLLSMDTARVDEFAAWRRGAERLLGSEDLGDGRFLLVSLGTGTSVLLVDGVKTTRVGGTALGGGTIVGLGAGLIGTPGFEALAALARRGDRRRVDLLVSEVGDVPLPGDVTASALAKLARPAETPREPADVAHAVMGLVGENVALICNALAASHGVSRIVYAGSTLRQNPALVAILSGLTRVLGHHPILLPDGEFAGAIGALELALSGLAGPRARAPASLP